MSVTQKYGIIAGAGDLPLKVIDQCVHTHKPFHIISIHGQTPESCVHDRPHSWSGLAQFGNMVRDLKKNQCTDVVMAGYFERPNFADLKPDLKGSLVIAKLIGKPLGDDALLRILVEAFEREGFNVVGSEDILGLESLIDDNLITTRVPNGNERESIQRGYEVAKALGAIDVGQAVIIEDGLVLGVEAIEGTDRLIERCGQMPEHQAGQGILIKVIKPNQDVRVDRSVLGMRTLENLKKYQFAGVAAEAGHVILLGADEMISFANQNDLFIIGVSF